MNIEMIISASIRSRPRGNSRVNPDFPCLVIRGAASGVTCSASNQVAGGQRW